MSLISPCKQGALPSSLLSPLLSFPPVHLSSADSPHSINRHHASGSPPLLYVHNFPRHLSLTDVSASTAAFPCPIYLYGAARNTLTISLLQLTVFVQVDRYTLYSGSQCLYWQDDHHTPFLSSLRCLSSFFTPADIVNLQLNAAAPRTYSVGMKPSLEPLSVMLRSCAPAAPPLIK